VGIGRSRYAYVASAVICARPGIGAASTAVEKEPYDGGPCPPYACFMAHPPLPLNIREGRPSRSRRWVIDAQFYFDRETIADWVSLMVSDLERPNCASPMATARHTVQLMHYTADFRSAARALATQGHPAGRTLLADVALDINSALEGLYTARNALLTVTGAQQVTYTDE
jgi:hypothetical protein